MAKTPSFDIGPMNKGIDNVSPAGHTSNGRCDIASNVEFLRSGGWSTRIGSTKKNASPFSANVIGVTQLTRRDGTNKYLIFFDDGSIFDYDGNVTFTDSAVSQNAPSFHHAVGFYKGNEDYIVFTGGTDYIKKLSWSGNWGEVTSVTGTPADDLIVAMRYVSTTEVYCVISGTAAGVYLWNGTTWALFCPLMETLTVNNYFALDGTDYVYAATSGGVYVFSSTWNFWHLLGTDTDAYFDVLATATNAVYAVKDTKIRKYTTAWADVHTVSSVAKYKIKYVNSNIIVLCLGTLEIAVSQDGTSWSSYTLPSVTPWSVSCDNFSASEVTYSGGYIFIIVCGEGSDFQEFGINFSVTNNFTSWVSDTQVDPAGGMNPPISNSPPGTPCPSISYATDGTYHIVTMHRRGTYLYTFTASVLTGPYVYQSEISTITSTGGKIHHYNGVFYRTNIGYDILKSSVDGETWSDITCSIKCDSLQYVNGQLYAACKDTTIKQALSVDGSTWQAQFTHYIYVSDTEQYGCKSDGVFYFDGSTWAELGDLTNVVKLGYLSATSIYACTDTGLQRWDGSAWEKQSVIGIDDIRDINVVSANEIYVASYGAGVFKWDGLTLAKHGSSIDSNNITAIASAPSKTYAGVYESGVASYVLGYSLENVGDRVAFGAKISFTGTVDPSGTTISSISTGTVAQLKIGGFISHPSFPAFIYITDIPDTTSIVVSEPLTDPGGAHTYDNIEYISAPRAKYVEVYNDMLFAGYTNYDGQWHPSEINFSRDDENDMDEWINPTTLFRKVQTIGFGDNDFITGIKSVGRVLAIWKNNSLYSLSGTNENNISISKVSDIGCVIPNSIQVVTFNNGHTASIFLSRNGFYVFDGSNVYQNDSMKYYACDIDMSKVDLATSSFNVETQKYKLSFWENSGTRKTVTYQSQLDAFSEETNYADAFGTLEGSEYRGLATALYRNNNGSTDNGTPITFTFRTQLYSMNSPGMLKAIRELLHEYKSKNSAYTMNVYVENNTTPVYTISDSDGSTTTLHTDRKPFGVNSRYVQFEITGTAELVEFYRLVYKYRNIGER